MKITVPKILTKGAGDLVSKLDNLIDSHVSQIHTTTIGVIQSFNPETQTVVVQPAIKKVITSEDQTTIIYTSANHPLLTNVPVVFPGGGDWFMTFPIKEGDECLIFSMERSIGEWMKNGGVQDPSTYKRKLSFKDAIVMVGLNSKASSLPEFNAEQPELRNRAGDVKLTMTETGMILTGECQLTGDTDNAVRYSALETAYNELNNKFNGLISVLEPIFTGTPIPEPGNGSPSALQLAIATAWASAYLTFVPPVATLESSGDITPSKVEEILVP